MAKSAWQTWAIGVLATGLAVTTGLWVVRRPERFSWPVPAIARRVRPSVTVVLNYQHGKLKGMGTGVVVRSRGDVVTNYHVVAHASRVDVVLANGRRYTAQIVGTDPAIDLAVVYIPHAGPLTAIQFASSSRVVPGELAVAIGNSLGLTYSVTAGVISAVGRTLPDERARYPLIQTDAAINPGNSGGPLLNIQGKLIGINSSKIAQTGVEGIGFAIPANVVRRVVDDILSKNQARPAALGLTVAGLEQQTQALFVDAVATGGPSARAGLHVGDFIHSINGHPVGDLDQWTAAIAQYGTDSSLHLGVWNGSTAEVLTVHLPNA